jgi:hypothetical protein
MRVKIRFASTVSHAAARGSTAGRFFGVHFAKTLAAPDNMAYDSKKGGEKAIGRL